MKRINYYIINEYIKVNESLRLKNKIRNVYEKKVLKGNRLSNISFKK